MPAWNKRPVQDSHGAASCVVKSSRCFDANAKKGRNVIIGVGVIKYRVEGFCGDLKKGVRGRARRG